jgi:hypothetical protein
LAVAEAAAAEIPEQAARLYLAVLVVAADR